MSWHEGATLRARLDNGHRFGCGETAELGSRILKGLAGLHRLSIVHRDIKPDNLHLDTEGRLRILDLGVAASTPPATDRNSGDQQPRHPELHGPGALRSSEGANEQTDLYAVGVTLYQLLTRKYPYGEIEPFQTPRFGDPAPPTRYRPDIPDWLEAVLLKAVAREPKARFETAEEFLLPSKGAPTAPSSSPANHPCCPVTPNSG
jgi:protein phosphatase